MDLSILIVNYNTCQLTVDCLRSVFASETDYTYEVILIDNNSKDESVQTIRELFPQVKQIENTENTGFAKANNQGMEVAEGRYIALNSDTIIQQDTIQTMVALWTIIRSSVPPAVKSSSRTARWIRPAKRVPDAFSVLLLCFWAQQAVSEQAGV